MDIVIVGLVGLVVGEVMRRRLNKLTYRLAPDEHEADETARTAEVDEEVRTEEVDETALPSPGARWWCPAVLGIAWGCVGWRCPVVLPHGWPDIMDWIHLLGWLAFCAIGLWMAAIDLDVRRLPDRGQVILAIVMVLCGVLISWEEPIRLAYGLGAGLVCGLAFLLMHAMSRGGLGLGDVKLVMTCGWWLGLTWLTSVFAALMISCVLAVAYSLLARQRQFAFGPWLVAGTLIAGLYLR